VNPTAARSERERIDEELAARARAFARPQTGVAAAPALEVVAFGSGDTRYAIAAPFVRRIERLGRVTPLPGAPAHFAGLMNLHGQLIPLVDLGRLYGAPACPNAVFAVIVGAARPDVGIVTESILGMQAGGAHVVDAAALLDDPRLTIGAPTPLAPPPEHDR
jgi:chemotaxis signal transduction protein